MSRRNAWLLYVSFIAVLWIVALPVAAWADTCRERADAIAAGRKPPNEPDPDCQRAAVIGTTVAIAGGAAAAGITAVRLGLGGRAGPAGGAANAGTAAITQANLSGPAAIDVLIKSGLVTPVTDSSGNPIWYRDPKTGQVLRDPNTGDPIPVVKPTPTFDDLGGKPVARTVDALIDPATGLPAQVQNKMITGVAGFAGRTRPDGTLDPNVAIVVNQTQPGDWVAPVETPTATPPGPTPPPTGQQQQSGPQSGGSTQAPPQVQGPPQKPPQVQPPVVQVPPQVTTPPPTPPVPPKTQTPPPPDTAKPQAPDAPGEPSKPTDARTPKNLKDLDASLSKPGTTLISPQMGGFLKPDGTVAKLPGGVPGTIELGPLTARIVPEQTKLDTSGGRVTATVTVQAKDDFITQATITEKASLTFTTKDGKIVAVPAADPTSQAAATAANAYLDTAAGPNGQFANKGLDVVSITADPDGTIRVVTRPRAKK